MIDDENLIVAKYYPLMMFNSNTQTHLNNININNGRTHLIRAIAVSI